MDVNYLGTVYATRAVVPQMKARRSGRIVLVSSQAGQLGLNGYTGYSASKFALLGLAESLQMEVSGIFISLLPTSVIRMHARCTRAWLLYMVSQLAECA